MEELQHVIGANGDEVDLAGNVFECVGKCRRLQHRPDLDLEKIATGEHWYGTRAIELGLVDELKTSDELLAELAKDHDLYRVAYKMKMPLQRRLLSSVDSLLERADNLYWRRRFEDRLPR